MMNLSLYNKLVIAQKDPADKTSPYPGMTIMTADTSGNLTTQNVQVLKAYLTGSQETIANNSKAKGAAIVAVDTQNKKLYYVIAYDNLKSAETAAHIHGPALPGQEALPIFSLPNGNVKVGVWNYDSARENEIISGRTYINIHSTTHPNGEIRGQLVF